MSEFDSYYWNVADLVEVDRRAAQSLIDGTDPREVIGAFLLLLKSDHAAAQGMALDHFEYAERMTRFGLGNPFAENSALVLSTARQLLREPPAIATSARGTRVIGANYASACLVLRFLGNASDLDAIAPLLEPTIDSAVVEAALMAVDHCLTSADTGTATRIGARLTTLFQDNSLDHQTRLFAVGVFSGHPALNQEEALVAMVLGDSPSIGARAGLILAE